jgi:hypothetical protein
MWEIPYMPTAAPLAEYDAHVDDKKRLTIRGTKFEYFRVVHRADGTILLKPRVMKDAPLSAATARAMDKAMKNLSAGKRGVRVDLKKLAAAKV